MPDPAHALRERGARQDLDQLLPRGLGHRRQYLAELCERIGGDWSEIAPALKLDRRIGPYAYLTPGLGIAGGNLERDLATVQRLSDAHGTEAGLISAWLRNSRHRRDWPLRELHERVIARVADPVIGVLGVTYKENTHSIKNSPAVALIREWRVAGCVCSTRRCGLRPNGTRA